MSETPDNEGTHWVQSIVVGIVLILLGGFLLFNGGDVCLAIQFADQCIIGGTTFGLIAGLIGVLSFWGGIDAYRTGEKRV